MSLWFFSLIRWRDELPILLLTIVRTRQERISQLNKNERKKPRDEKRCWPTCVKGSISWENGIANDTVKVKNARHAFDWHPSINRFHQPVCPIDHIYKSHENRFFSWRTLQMIKVVTELWFVVRIWINCPWFNTKISCSIFRNVKHISHRNKSSDFLKWCIKCEIEYQSIVYSSVVLAHISSALDDDRSLRQMTRIADIFLELILSWLTRFLNSSKQWANYLAVCLHLFLPFSCALISSLSLFLSLSLS